MDNRRQPPSGPNDFNRNKPFRKEGDRPSGLGKYQNQDRKFQPRNDRYPRNEAFQPRDARPPREGFKPREGGYQPREGGYQPREGGYQRREGFQNQNQNQNREGFQNREGYQNRDNRFGRRDNNPGGPNKFYPKNDKFQPRRGFAPKGKKPEPWAKENNIRIVSDMQVTDGKHKGKYLVTTASPKMKPTSRRLREVAFKILFRRVRAKRFLDLCAGCGMIGIEAISRGAIVATMVERSARMTTVIRKNLASTEIKEGHGEVVEMEAAPFLKKMAKKRRFWDIVYYASPGDATGEDAMRFFARGAGIAPGGQLVIEHQSESFFPERIGLLKRFRVVVQGESTLSFYERK